MQHFSGDTAIRIQVSMSSKENGIRPQVFDIVYSLAYIGISNAPVLEIQPFNSAIAYDTSASLWVKATKVDMSEYLTILNGK